MNMLEKDFSKRMAELRIDKYIIKNNILILSYDIIVLIMKGDE